MPCTCHGSDATRNKAPILPVLLTNSPCLQEILKWVAKRKKERTVSEVREEPLVISDERSSQTASDKLLCAMDGGNWLEDTRKKTPPQKCNYTHETH